MANLRDELLKKGLLGEKRARQLAHEEKARRKSIGAGGVLEERRQKDAEQRAREEARRDADRRREQARVQEEEGRREVFRIAQMLESRAVTEGIRGPRRFFFVTRSRAIPFLELSEEAAKRLENGALAICELPGAEPERFVLIPAETARRVREADPSLVRFFNDGSDRSHPAEA